ncbi:MAG: ISAzo13 family transposase [archaeon]|nr:ISAzo13 family transposase [archaeon]
MLNELMKEDTAGDPMSTRKWSRKDTRELSSEMKIKGISICANTVGKILKEGNYSLKANRKSINETTHPDRDSQFKQISETRKRFEDYGVPIISVDSKKKEPIGEFKNSGRTWRQYNREVFVHDFRSHASALAAPYGLYECILNRGTVVIGTSADTSEFAVDSIELWLTETAFKTYPSMDKFLILCDCGGSNGYRTRLWKTRLYEQIAIKYGLKVSICHYPPGASKWNPVEHRLFSFITMEWQGEPLTSLEFMKNKIEATTTRTGLKVKAHINEKEYEKGIKVPNNVLSNINIEYSAKLSKWNYSIMPN